MKQGFFSRPDLGGVNPDEFNWALKYQNLRNRSEEMRQEFITAVLVLRTVLAKAKLTEGAKAAERLLEKHKDEIK